LRKSAAKAPGWQPPPAEQPEHEADRSQDTNGGGADGGANGPRRYPSRNHATTIAHLQCEHQLPKTLMKDSNACMALTTLLYGESERVAVILGIAKQKITEHRDTNAAMQIAKASVQQQVRRPDETMVRFPDDLPDATSHWVFHVQWKDTRIYRGMLDAYRIVGYPPKTIEPRGRYVKVSWENSNDPGHQLASQDNWTELLQAFYTRTQSQVPTPRPAPAPLDAHRCASGTCPTKSGRAVAAPPAPMLRCPATAAYGHIHRS
jgi:hypothetical protein